MKEIWKDIKGFEKHYQASNLGRIKSVKREINHWRGGKSIHKEKILNQCLHTRGYLQVCLNGKTVLLVHQLIAETFIENPNNLPQINHKDGNKKNNSVLNLEWITHKDNNMHSWEKLGRRHKNSLTEEDGIEIRRKYIPYKYSMLKLANEYNVCENTVFEIIHSKQKYLYKTL